MNKHMTRLSTGVLGVLAAMVLCTAFGLLVVAAVWAPSAAVKVASAVVLICTIGYALGWAWERSPE